MIKAVVFDLDDTLISEKEYVFSGFNVVSKEISYRYEINRTRRAVFIFIGMI